MRSKIVCAIMRFINQVKALSFLFPNHLCGTTSIEVVHTIICVDE